MNTKVIIIIVLVSILGGGGAVWLLSRPPKPQVTGLDDFAKCLTEKGLVMYGAYWCPHCQAQKKLFGDSFQYVKYVECTTQAQLCLDMKVEGYPTWIASDGARLVGEIPLDKLATVTACQLPTGLQ